MEEILVDLVPKKLPSLVLGTIDFPVIYHELDESLKINGVNGVASLIFIQMKHFTKEF